ncbi:ArsA-related P-loop ATPase [Methylobacterium sp. NEAU K]|uniref:nucleotide-binding protein n=1 Tax=Methylobacterium sp. NEAU K TaxID=3064946 RepID=UPI0027331E5A|nr:ArsA-related P-loop ATPase [Methylobacterium sp. NEAU K]MDP4004094.1 ArsA-related P-loop ATPase [Methylobacterium sp. NEAU K]
MTDATQLKVPAWYTPTEIQDIQQDLLGSGGAKVLILCLGGKGGVGKTTIALQIADLCAEAGPVLAIDTDPANKHFPPALLRETEPGGANFVSRRPGVSCHRQRLRAEDSTGRVDPTLCQDMIERVADAAERFIVVDFPAGDTETTRRCSEIIVESCREEGIRLCVVVAAGAVDPTALDVLKELRPMLLECDRAILAKNTAQATNFDYLETSDLVRQLRAQPNFRALELERIGERLVEALRIQHMTWLDLATRAPMRLRVEGRRLRRNFHAAWREALRP